MFKYFIGKDVINKKEILLTWTHDQNNANMDSELALKVCDSVYNIVDHCLITFFVIYYVIKWFILSLFNMNWLINLPNLIIKQLL